MPTNNLTSAQDRMKSVTAAWDKVPAGPKKDAALQHDQAAGKLQAAKNEAECLKSLDAARPHWSNESGLPEAEFRPGKALSWQ